MLNHGPASWIVGNWQVSGTIGRGSGLPFGIDTSSSINAEQCARLDGTLPVVWTGLLPDECERLAHLQLGRKATFKLQGEAYNLTDTVVFSNPGGNCWAAGATTAAGYNGFDVISATQSTPRYLVVAGYLSRSSDY